MNLWSWRKISLRVRIYTVLTTLVAITLVGGLVMVWYTYRMESLLADLIDKNLAAYQAAEALESALIQQRGDASHFLLDGDARWLENLEKHRKTFKARVEEARDPSLGQVAVVRVRDNGPGIVESPRARVFEPFFTTKEEGFGLGLSIAARIVEKHGGRLDLESGKGQGAEFSLILPITDKK